MYVVFIVAGVFLAAVGLFVTFISPMYGMTGLALVVAACFSGVLALVDLSNRRHKALERRLEELLKRE